MKRTIMMLAVAVILAAGARFVAAEAHDMAAKISAAKTAADHEAIAAAYDKEAAEAKREAEVHDKMGAAYTGSWKEKLHLDDHCREISRQYREQAKAFEALAEAHRAQAKQMAK